MKSNLLILNLFVLLLLSWGCKKQNLCVDAAYEFNISPETKEWLPEEILKDEIKYQSENGEIVTFIKDTIYHNKPNFSIMTTCEDEMNMVSVDHERITHRYSSGDSLYISLEMGIKLTACSISVFNADNWVEEVLVKTGQWDKTSIRIVRTGVVNIATKIISTQLNEEICNILPSKFHENIQLQGMSYFDVYTDDPLQSELQHSEYPLSGVYFQKGKGIIAYKDKLGMVWVRIDD